MLGISVQAFYEMSPKEFYFALKARQERDSAIIEYEFKHAYEVARFQAVLVLNPFMGKGKQFKHPKELMQFTWEKGRVVKQSVDEMKQVIYAIANASKKKK